MIGRFQAELLEDWPGIDLGSPDPNANPFPGNVYINAQSLSCTRRLSRSCPKRIGGTVVYRIELR
jgi:hypothetical protein